LIHTIASGSAARGHPVSRSPAVGLMTCELVDRAEDQRAALDRSVLNGSSWLKNVLNRFLLEANSETAWGTRAANRALIFLLLTEVDQRDVLQLCAVPK